jgi:hypothetical protein
MVRKWVRGKVLGLPGTRLRKHWEHFRIWPSEEVERVNRQIGWSIILMSLILAVANGVKEIGRWQMARGTGDIPPLMQMALHLYWVGFGVLTVWMAILFVTPLWECVLYGVQERELEGLVRAAMRVSRVLRRLGPLRERQKPPRGRSGPEATARTVGAPWQQGFYHTNGHPANAGPARRQSDTAGGPCCFA